MMWNWKLLDFFFCHFSGMFFSSFTHIFWRIIDDYLAVSHITESPVLLFHFHLKQHPLFLSPFSTRCCIKPHDLTFGGFHLDKLFFSFQGPHVLYGLKKFNFFVFDMFSKHHCSEVHFHQDKNKDCSFSTERSWWIQTLTLLKKIFCENRVANQSLCAFLLCFSFLV